MRAERGRGILRSMGNLPTANSFRPWAAVRLAICLVAVAGCPRTEPPAELKAGAPTAQVAAAEPEPDAAAPLPDAGPLVVAPPAEPPGPAPLTLTVKALSRDQERPLVRGGDNDGLPIDLKLSLELPPLKDFRVRLFDDSDKAVPSGDRSEATSESVRYLLTPAEPLTPGSRYALLVDGLSEDLPKDSAGRSYQLVRIELKTAGEKPKAAGSKPAKAKKASKKP